MSVAAIIYTLIQTGRPPSSGPGVMLVHRGLRVPRFLLHPEGEDPAFIRRPSEPLQQRIRSASSSQAMCEGRLSLYSRRQASILALASASGQEPMRVQALVAKAPVERLHEGIVGRLPRPTEGPARRRSRKPSDRGAFETNSGPLVHTDGLRGPRASA